MAWSLIIHKILLKTTQLFSKQLRPSLRFCILYFFFHKGKDISAIPQSSIHYLARKKVFLKILPISQENIWVGVSFK